jgi:lipid II:glycine glycyltransferase (peptidoglycan interpeptide bridge formation enzyme)
MASFKIIRDQQVWDQALMALPGAHVLQSWAWGDFKSRWGWTAERLLWSRAGRPVAAAQILARAIPPTPWRFLYVTRGPLLDYADAGLAGQVLADLESYAQQTQALFIKIDPDVPRQQGAPQENCPPDPTGQQLLQMLEQRGWRFSPEQIQFRNTILIDLAAEQDELLARMKSKWRYNIRLAERRGVVVRSGGQAGLSNFYAMYAETARRDGFLIRPEAYYMDVWRQFLEKDQAELFLALVEDQAVAGLLLFIFGSRAWYMYGASSRQHHSLMPNHLLQWAALCRAKERGCAWYDMWGAPDIFDERDRLWSVYRFKQGFGGRVVQGLGAFDYPVRPLLYGLFIKALPQARGLWRRLITRQRGSNDLWNSLPLK